MIIGKIVVGRGLAGLVSGYVRGNGLAYLVLRDVDGERICVIDLNVDAFVKLAKQAQERR